MLLMDRKLEHIVIEITPEMIERIQELNQSVVEDMKRVSDIAALSMEMQNASMQAAIERGY